MRMRGECRKTNGLGYIWNLGLEDESTRDISVDFHVVVVIARYYRYYCVTLYAIQIGGSFGNLTIVKMPTVTFDARGRHRR